MKNLTFWLRFFFQNSEASLPVCSPNSVCNKLDTYGSPWVEKQCRCPKGSNPCSTSTHIRDGHTVTDRNRQYKVSILKNTLLENYPQKSQFYNFFIRKTFEYNTNCLFYQQICEPVKSLKKCKYFRDVTWTYITYPDNSTQQVMHCRCPKNSVAYLIRRHAYQTVTGTGYQYSFACSPQTVSFHLKNVKVKNCE